MVLSATTNSFTKDKLPKTAIEKASVFRFTKMEDSMRASGKMTNEMDKASKSIKTITSTTAPT